MTAWPAIGPRYGTPGGQPIRLRACPAEWCSRWHPHASPSRFPHPWSTARLEVFMGLAPDTGWTWCEPWCPLLCRNTIEELDALRGQAWLGSQLWRPHCVRPGLKLGDRQSWDWRLSQDVGLSMLSHPAGEWPLFLFLSRMQEHPACLCEAEAELGLRKKTPSGKTQKYSA